MPRGKDGSIIGDATAVSTFSASGIWTMSEVHKYKTEGIWPRNFTLEYLLIGGGGAGGGNHGGGGAGGYRLATISTEYPGNLTPAQTSGGSHVGDGTTETPLSYLGAYDITLGSGSTTVRVSGDPTILTDNNASGTGTHAIIAYGGGAGTDGSGAYGGGDSTDIGSGGGGASTSTAGVVTDNGDQGFNGGAYSGGAGGGGGGAGALGVDGSVTGHGGAGLFSSITGVSTQRGGGGGGALDSTSSPYNGGAGGGGSGDYNYGAVQNTGGGGGGGHAYSWRHGMDGVIIIKIPDAFSCDVASVSGVTSTEILGSSVAVLAGFKVYVITAVTGTKTITFS
tara:strand:+ start:581 stop:1591 length:1011 start_codon:yes stop_codon:yes gene_type:complete